MQFAPLRLVVDDGYLLGHEVGAEPMLRMAVGVSQIDRPPFGEPLRLPQNSACVIRAKTGIDDEREPRTEMIPIFGTSSVWSESGITQIPSAISLIALAAMIGSLSW